MRELITTLLDTLGVLAVAAGAGLAVATDPRVGAGAATSGVVLLAAVRVHDWLAERGRGGRR